MLKSFSKKISVLVLLFLMVNLVCVIQIYKVEAATSSKVTASSSVSKANNSKSSATDSKTQSGSKNGSKAASSQSESLLPDDGNSLPPAAAQNWDQIMSDINKTADKDEFTFTEEPSHLGFFGSKLSYMGFGLILISILGFTYFFYSTFFSKKSPRKLKKLMANSASSNNNLSNKNYRSNRQPQPKGSAPKGKSVYSDGYGYTKNPQPTRPVNRAPQGAAKKPSAPKPQNKINLENKIKSDSLPKAKHMLDDDSDIIMSNFDSNKGSNFNKANNKPGKNPGKKSNKKDEFWNDFFLD